MALGQAVTWKREGLDSLAWCDAALLNAIGPQLKRLRSQVEEAKAELIWVEGDGYAGWVILTFQALESGGTQCTVEAVAGVGLRACLPDIARLLKANGVTVIRCEAASVALARLYESAGLKAVATVLELEI